MQKLASTGGVLASLILIALGVGSIIVSLNGRDEVRDTLADENIVGSPDMDPDAIEITTEADTPDCSVADETVDTGDEAKCFADYMRIHALESTGGLTYAEMPRFLDEKGEPVEDEADAATDPDSGEPVENGLRDLWVTETALATALNTSYFAEQVARFGLVVGIAMVLIGIGFLVLTWFGLLGHTRDRAGTA
jgi:putative Mn2+ efflux pump MntP